ncbi:MAG: hypothetical protein M3N59_00570 [bacterium]|nr:hypothetical protein [bacterium]
MRIRSEITLNSMGWTERPDRPADDAEIVAEDRPAPELNRDLYNPENAEQLAVVRQHCMEHPQGILLDVYQAVTELELKHPPGSLEAQRRHLRGLRGEVKELSDELLKALVEHPYHAMGHETEGPADAWIMTVLDYNRLRFNDLDGERKKQILGELGDVLWYASRVAAESGSSLSRSFVAFLRDAGAGGIKQSYDHGFGEAIETRAGEILDVRLVQDIALSQKKAFTVRTDPETPDEALATIDNMPHRLLERIYGDELYASSGGDVWDTERPYEHLPHTEVTVGKLVWFVAYTSNSLLNADFATVMRANLEKITRRSQHGTIFSRQDRGVGDEAELRTARNTRVPLE